MLESDYFDTNPREVESLLSEDGEFQSEPEDRMFKAENLEINYSAFKNMLNVEDESVLEIENWMTEVGNFDASISQFYEMTLVDFESSLEVENWMLNEINFGTGEAEFVYSLKTVAEPDLNVEAWMIDIDFFETEVGKSSESTIVDIAVSNPDFSILVEAVSKAGLAEALNEEGPFTVFAPTNHAFNSLFKQLGVSGISDLSKEQLTPILVYHVVAGKVMSSELSNTSVGTLNTGKSIEIDITNGVKINDSKVVKADISGENGVIHVIDKVLIPSEGKNSGCTN